MRTRKYKPHLAKLHRNYTVGGVDDIYGVFKGAVRNFIEAGLPVLNKKRLMLILSSDLITFHQAGRTMNKQKCLPEEIYCVSCRKPKIPVDHPEYLLMLFKRMVRELLYEGEF